MKTVSVLVAGASSVLGAHLNHYTDMPECTEKISTGIHMLAHSVLALQNQDVASLKDSYAEFENVHKLVAGCREMALDKGVVPIPPAVQLSELDMKYALNSTTARGNCMTDLKKLFIDASKSARDLAAALAHESIPSVLTALKDVKKVEADITECQSDCTDDHVQFEMERSACAAAVDAVVGKITFIGEDVRSIAHDDNVVRVLAVRHELLDVPVLATQVATACDDGTISTESRALALAHSVDGVQHESLFTAVIPQVKKAAAAAVANMDEDMCKHECLNKAAEVSADVMMYASLLNQAGNMPLAFKRLASAQHTHTKVADAIVTCHMANDNFF